MIDRAGGKLNKPGTTKKDLEKPWNNQEKPGKTSERSGKPGKTLEQPRKTWKDLGTIWKNLEKSWNNQEKPRKTESGKTFVTVGLVFSDRGFNVHDRCWVPRAEYTN
ncbi:MAG: hypothetical protein P4N59_09550 [Negativicutes bacterium]|nr:hypothetical protein [Negativicutes bacterium]